MRQAFQSNMFTFTDKLMACLGEMCTCCKAHGRKMCILKSEQTTIHTAPPTPSTDQLSTPLVSKIGPRLPAPGLHEGVFFSHPLPYHHRNNFSVCTTLTFLTHFLQVRCLPVVQFRGKGMEAYHQVYNLVRRRGFVYLPPMQKMSLVKNRNQ